MKIGFTGTEKGMTDSQFREVERILFHIIDCDEVDEVHHGGCIGGDALFHNICSKLGLPIPIVHPASDVAPYKRAILDESKISFLPAKPALKRNHDIVDSVDIMIAAPAQDHEVLRSGTWATIRYAKKVGKIVRIIYPYYLPIGNE